MNTFQLGLVFLYCIVSIQLCGCTSLDDGSNPAVTARKLRPASTGGQNNDTRTDDHLQDSNEEYISAEYEDDDTRVSTKSKDSIVTAIKGQGKGRARENPCLTEKYRHYCIHGVCRYLAELNHTSCICDTGYSGDRCHLFILPVGKEAEGNSHTTALAVMAAGLSLMCFTVIGVLLALRFQKRVTPVRMRRSGSSYCIAMKKKQKTPTSGSVDRMATIRRHPVHAEEENGSVQNIVCLQRTT